MKYPTMSKTRKHKIVLNVPIKSSDEAHIKCPICGNERTVLFRRVLESSNTLCRSCSRVKDIEGIRFERWLVIGLDKIEAGNAYWLCRCDCGKVKSVLSYNLLGGMSQSCGCFRDSNRPSGKDHYAWDDTITDEERVTRRDYKKYKQWRDAVFARDQSICRCCHKRPKIRNAHHLYSYKHYPQYREKVWNGVTLCKGCHADFHYNFMGSQYARCTPRDFYLYLKTQSRTHQKFL